MSLRNKIIFFATIIGVFAFALFVLVIPNTGSNKEKNYITLSTPTIACSSINNYKDMLEFSAKKDYESAEQYLNSEKCMRLEKGTEVEILKNSEVESVLVRPKDKTIHLFIPSTAIKFNY